MYGGSSGINLKFRLFGNQKVPDMGVSGGKIQVIFP
jgi:hypothetical protein